MKQTLKQFYIFIPTQFGLGIIKKRAHDAHDAFSRLGKKDQSKLGGWIEDEGSESITFRAILGLEELI
jgi:hypothetical protein